MMRETISHLRKETKRPETDIKKLKYNFLDKNGLSFGSQYDKQ